LDVGLREGSGIFGMAPPTRALGMASAKVHAEIVLAMALARVLEPDRVLDCAREQGYLGWLLLRYLRRILRRVG